MFTGLVAGQGKITRRENRGSETHLSVQALFELPKITVGESIAVSGVCLTVETGSNNRFTAYASAETLAASMLGDLKVGSPVNLERALALGDRLGGHIVSGHVDCVATVHSVTPAGLSRRIRLNVATEISAEIIAKGSVALDGISLTVNDCGPGYLEVNVIPETWRVTTIAGWIQGVGVNLETDCIAKYVRHMLGPYLPGAAQQPDAAKGVSLNFLQENGFFS